MTVLSKVFKPKPDNTINRIKQVLFNNKKMSDIKFEFVNDINDDGDNSNNNNTPFVIYAHSFILGARSRVFSESFEDLIEKQKVIKISTSVGKLFYTFLRFLYTDSCKMNTNNVWELYHLSKVYEVGLLTQICTKYIIKTLTIPFAAIYLEKCLTINEIKLKPIIINYIKNNFFKILRHRNILTIDSDTLCEIFKINNIKNNNNEFTEYDVINAAIEWSIESCKPFNDDDDNDDENNIINKKITYEKMRLELDKAIYQIRFLQMTINEFQQFIKKYKNFLSENEITNICLGITSKNKIKCEFEAKSRFEIVL